jgi:signal transduction histidine kinase
MNWLHSLRWRLLLGTALWSLGLIPLLHLLFLIAHGQLHRYMAPWGIAVFLVFAFLCIATGIWQYRSGLVPFGRLRQQLMGLRSGAGERIEGNYPAEVQPLVNDLNTLLEQRERAIRRALSKAGDLAHGLKTPLAVLAQVERMRRQIEYHLSQARTITPGNVAGTRCPVQVCVEGLTRTLEKIYAARGLAIKVDVAAEHSVRGQREDLEEILGNLLDNACKWARTAVRIQSLQEKDAVVLLVDDDGPGLPSSMRDEVLKRGVRMDEAAPGSGLGLAIARDLVQLYEGTLKLEESPMGGLRARVRLPC